MYVRVSVVDCLSGEEIEELGFFSRSFAERFVREWNNETAEMPHENRLVILESAEIQKAA